MFGPTELQCFSKDSGVRANQYAIKTLTALRWDYTEKKL